MDNNDIRNLIKIPEGLDKAVFNGIEKGRKEKKDMNRKKIFKRGIIAAGIVLVLSITTWIINPELVKAMPIVGKVFESFNSTLFGEPTDKFQDVADLIGKSEVNRGGTITLDEAILDDNILMLALTVESNFLKGYEGMNESDFFNLNADITINGTSPSSYGTKVRKISDSKGAIILECNISELNVKENIDIKLEIREITRGFDTQKGKWEFNLNIKKKEGGRRLKFNEEINYNGNNLIAEELVISKLRNTLILKGKDSIDNEVFNRFIIKDDSGRYLKSEQVYGVSNTNTGEFNKKIEIKEDLSNVKYIELTPKKTKDVATESIDGIEHIILKTTGNENSDYENKIISRAARSEEIKAGYAYDKVQYYINMDKAKEFKKIQELIGSKIKVNSNEFVKIKNIEVTDRATKVTFELIGMYNYNNLNNMVIFDENMNDLARREGQNGVAIEDNEDGIFSIALDKIDTSKKYKIAIPMEPETEEVTPEWKMIINLK